MILTISTTHQPATDLGYLLHKNPSRTNTAEMAFGSAHLFYPEAGEERCTVAVLLEVDVVKLVRGISVYDQYVNDRPYVANSFMSSALLEFFSTAMSGRSKERPELAEMPIPVEIHLPCLPCRGGRELLERLFAPLGYEIDAVKLPLDEKFAEWGDSAYFRVTLRGNQRVQDLLAHLYVLIPVLDYEKHYWIEKAEIEKLLNRGGSWLPSHPAKNEIARRYMKNDRSLTQEAIARLVIDEPEVEAEELEEVEEDQPAEATEKKISLHDQRLLAVAAALKQSGAKRVLDLGCGEGKLLRLLMKDRQFTEIVGMDVSISTLQKSQRRLKIDRLPPMQAARLKLIHGSLMYRDKRLEGYDAAAVVEVIEHLDEPRLASFERILFAHARPTTVVITTPNKEYNALFPSMEEGQMRHGDHRFEWTRQEFESWANRIGDNHGYAVAFAPLGPVDAEVGAPSQMATLTLMEGC